MLNKTIVSLYRKRREENSLRFI